MKAHATVLAFLSIIIFAGCVSLTPGGEQVRVVRDRQAIAGCESLGTMFSTSGHGGVAASGGDENNRRQLRNDTAKRGGNTLLILSGEGGGYWVIALLGEAYRCPQTPTAAPAPIQPAVQPTTANGQRKTIEAECRRLWPDNREQFEICTRQ